MQRQYVLDHNPDVPAREFRNDLRCLEDSVGIGSALYCFVRGKWTTFQGAD